MSCQSIASALTNLNFHHLFFHSGVCICSHIWVPLPRCREEGHDSVWATWVVSYYRWLFELHCDSTTKTSSHGSLRWFHITSSACKPGRSHVRWLSRGVSFPSQRLMSAFEIFRKCLHNAPLLINEYPTGWQLRHHLLLWCLVLLIVQFARLLCALPKLLLSLK